MIMVYKSLRLICIMTSVLHMIYHIMSSNEFTTNMEVIADGYIEYEYD